MNNRERVVIHGGMQPMFMYQFAFLDYHELMEDWEVEENTNNDVVEEFECRNPDIGFVTKCEVQGPMRPKVLFRC
jgi:hypothetical protein